MKICYFVSEFPEIDLETMKITNPLGGGVGYVAYHLAYNMSLRNNEVHVFTTAIGSKDIIESKNNFYIHRYKNAFSIGQAPMSISLLMNSLWEHVDSDVIHCHIGNMPAPLAGYLYAKKWNIPMIISHHGDWTNNYGSFFRRLGVTIYQQFLCDKLFQLSDKIVALSDQHLCSTKILRDNANKVHIIPNGINVTELIINVDKKKCREILGLPVDHKLMLFVGSFSPAKSIDVLIKSMKEVIATEPKVTLILAGDGYLREYLVELTQELKLSDNIIFWGQLVNEQKRLLYNASDVFILPSKSEAFPIVILEAATCGLPIIVSDIDRIKSIITDDQNGLTFLCGDSHDLSKKIISCIKNDELRKRLGSTAREGVKQYDWAHIASLYDQLYKSSTK
jgi:glycosyltransferase involved in cell wall biosynthesis